LKKKKEEEAKAEEDFCCCRASALFGYSFGRYFAGGKAEMYATLLVDTSLEVKLKCTHAFFFLGVSLAFYWSFFPFLSLIGFCFCVFFYETPECNFVCSGRRRSSSS